MAAQGGTITGGAASLRKGARASLVLALTSLMTLLALTPQNAAASPGWAQVLNRPTPAFGGIDFVSENQGWLTAGAGLLHTTDGGATWNEAAQLSGNDVDFADVEHGWLVGVSGAIYGTRDGGETWTPEESGTQVHLRDVVAVGPEEAWAVGSWEGYSDAISYPIATALLHTTDGGTTWQRVDTPANTWFGMVTFVGDAGWAWGQACGPVDPDPSSPCSGDLRSVLLRTIDGGATWSLADVTSPSGASDLVFVDQDHGWIAGADCPPNYVGPCVNNIYSTLDGGVTWQVVPATKGWEVHGLTFHDTMTGWAVRHECQFPVCSLSLMATADGGATWSDSPIAEAPQSASVLAVTNSGLYVVGKGVALRSLDAGATWEQMEHPAITFDDFAFVDRRTGYALSEGALLTTADGGRSWTLVGPAPSATRSVEFPAAGVGFAAGGTCDEIASQCDLSVYRTRDGGESWTVVDTRGRGSSAVGELRFRTSALGWSVLGETTLVLTADGAATWTAQPMTTWNTVSDVEMLDQSEGWAIMSSVPSGGGRTEYRVMRSMDGGATWQPSGLPGASYAQNLQFVDREHGWYATTTYGETCHVRVALTTDAGESWEEIDVGNQLAVRDMLFVSPLVGWISAAPCGQSSPASIWQTTDGGRSWEQQSQGEHLVGVLAAVDESAAWLVSEHPMGIGGAPPSRTYLYQTLVTEQPIQFPITGRRAVADSDALPIAAIALLGVAFATGALTLRRHG